MKEEFQQNPLKTTASAFVYGYRQYDIAAS
jgi:hypothetical protein